MESEQKQFRHTSFSNGKLILYGNPIEGAHSGWLDGDPEGEFTIEFSKDVDELEARRNPANALSERRTTPFLSFEANIPDVPNHPDYSRLDYKGLMNSNVHVCTTIKVKFDASLA